MYYVKKKKIGKFRFVSLIVMKQLIKSLVFFFACVHVGMIAFTK